LNGSSDTLLIRDLETIQSRFQRRLANSLDFFGGDSDFMRERVDDIFEQMSLSIDQLAKMQNDLESLVALRNGVVVSLTHTGQFDLEFGAVALELFGKFLGHGESFEGIVALAFGLVETFLELCRVDLLFVDEERETVGLALVLFDLGLEFLRFLRELRRKRLELFELQTSASAVKKC
jgi:hypothetical protein